MRLLIITDAWKPQVNGVVRTYEYLAPELERRGHVVKIIGPRDMAWHTPLPGYKEIDLALFPYAALSRMIDRFAPESLHIATEGPLGFAARQYCIKSKIAFHTAYHTQFPDYVAKRAGKLLPGLYQPVRNALIRKIIRFHNTAAAVMTATKSLEDELLSWGLESPVHRVIRGVAENIFHPDGESAIENLPAPRALYVGRVAIEKNLEAFLKMPWSGSKIVVGDGPSLSRLKQVYPCCHFTGAKFGAELASYYRGADVFVFPSRTDTFGMVLVEALACGTPVAGYDVTGPRDIVTENFLGAIDDDLSVAATKALSAPGTRSDRARHIRTHYTWPAAAQQFCDIAERIRISPDVFSDVDAGR